MKVDSKHFVKCQMPRVSIRNRVRTYDKVFSNVSPGDTPRTLRQTGARSRETVNKDRKDY